MKTAISALVALHLAATIWHGEAHEALEIGLSPAQNAFVYLVILLAPIVATGLLWTRFESAGLALLVVAMIGALVFGVYHHYVHVSPDNVAHLPAGSPEAHARFVDSAALIALLELATAICAAYGLGARRGATRAERR